MRSAAYWPVSWPSLDKMTDAALLAKLRQSWAPAIRRALEDEAKRRNLL